MFFLLLLSLQLNLSHWSSSSRWFAEELPAELYLSGSSLRPTSSLVLQCTMLLIVQSSVLRILFTGWYGDMVAQLASLLPHSVPEGCMFHCCVGPACSPRVYLVVPRPTVHFPLLPIRIIGNSSVACRFLSLHVNLGFVQGVIPP